MHVVELTLKGQLTWHRNQEQNVLAYQSITNNVQLLDRKKLVINCSQRPLSTQEEDVLSLGLSFAITPRQIPYQEIISATEATAHRLDHGTADALRLAVSGALKQAKAP